MSASNLENQVRLDDMIRANLWAIFEKLLIKTITKVKCLVSSDWISDRILKYVHHFLTELNFLTFSCPFFLSLLSRLSYYSHPLIVSDQSNFMILPPFPYFLPFTTMDLTRI